MVQIHDGSYAYTAAVDSSHRLLVNASGTTIPVSGTHLGTSGALMQPQMAYIQKIAYTAAGLPEYIGFSTPGNNAGSATWQIRKNTYNASNQITDVQFASGTEGVSGIGTFTYIFTNRGNYGYE